MNVASANGSLQAIRANILKAFVGREETVDLLLVALLSGGHVLIQDVPGVGKTTLATALAKSLDARFRRIQFTPDLLPSDVLGVSIYDAREQKFRFEPGPVFCHVLLADEINRTPPRTQSALLECMSERQVTVDGVTRDLEAPFMVLATMNPVEHHGTYELPESQLDRFLMCVKLGYPDRDGERRIFREQKTREPLRDLQPVVTLDEIPGLRRTAESVVVAEAVEDYVLDLIAATRVRPEIVQPASPRATLSLLKASQALALVRGRNYVIPDDVKDLAVSVLGHRIQCMGLPADSAIREVLDRTPVP